MLGLGFGFTSESSLRRSGTVTPAWTPLDLGSALIAWWNADDHGTANMVDDGAGLISSWTDRKGGLAYTGTTTQRPTWGATAAGAAYAGVTADGVGNFLSGALTGFPTGSSESCLAALIDQTTTALTTPVFHYGTAGATLNRQLIKNNANRLGVAVQGTTLTDTGHTFTGLHFVFGNYTATTLTGYFDDDPTTPATAAVATVATGTTRGRIFADTTTAPTTFGKGAARHIFVLGPLTTQQRQQLAGWNLWDVGLQGNLPVGHPYKSARP